MTTLYFDCIAGASGDMLLGALVDLGVPAEYIQSQLALLNLQGYALSFEKSLEHSISVTRCHVRVNEDVHHHRHLSDIIQLIEESKLSELVKSRSKEMFMRLGQIEANIHQQPLEKVHFHEVGAVDSIVDIIGCNIGFEYLQVNEFIASPLPIGWGTLKCAHGVLPVPAPATLKLVEGVPVMAGNNEGEVLTPTGALVITTLAKTYGPLPNLTIKAAGYSAGQKKLPNPNLLRLILGETTASNNLEQDQIMIIETNIDDQNPEFYSAIFDQLLQAGALDVCLIPMQMKKNRPGHQLKVFCSQEKLSELNNLILTHTSSIGVRFYPAQRTKLLRKQRVVSTTFGRITVKIAGLPGQPLSLTGNFAPEYDDCLKLAQNQQVPVKTIYQEALLLAIQAFKNNSIEEL